MCNLAEKVTIEDAMRVYENEGICCIGDNGGITVEIEAEDYCDQFQIERLNRKVNSLSISFEGG